MMIVVVVVVVVCSPHLFSLSTHLLLLFPSSSFTSEDNPINIPFHSILALSSAMIICLLKANARFCQSALSPSQSQPLSLPIISAPLDTVCCLMVMVIVDRAAEKKSKNLTVHWPAANEREREREVGGWMVIFTSSSQLMKRGKLNRCNWAIRWEREWVGKWD